MAGRKEPIPGFRSPGLGRFARKTTRESSCDLCDGDKRHLVPGADAVDNQVMLGRSGHLFQNAAVSGRTMPKPLLPLVLLAPF